jgi:hypothetical protein
MAWDNALFNIFRVYPSAVLSTFPHGCDESRDGQYSVMATVPGVSFAQFWPALFVEKYPNTFPRANPSFLIRKLHNFVDFRLMERMNNEIHRIQFESIINVIQMKLMKVIDNVKSIMMQKFQYFAELQLIDVVNGKMQKIQFESILYLI